MTSSSSRKTRFSSSPASSRICVSAASSSRAALSSREIPRRSALRAKARYMAPVSRLSSPKCRARWRATVLLPAPAGPSMATMICRSAAWGRRRTFGPAHPRFFVPLFGRAVKPKRLLFPALAPAASAGLRFPRDVRASMRTSLRVRAVLRLRPEGLPAVFATFAWPLCLPQAGVVGLSVPCPGPIAVGALRSSIRSSRSGDVPRGRIAVGFPVGAGMTVLAPA